MAPLQLVQQSLPPRILVVDDDEGAAAGIAEALAATGRDVTTCSDAICASVLLDHQHFDAVISDLHLRGSFTFDGLSVAARAKAVNPAVRLVMMTGYAS